MAASIKPVYWVGDSKKIVSALAQDVRDTVGQALFEAQLGRLHSSAKPMRSFGGASVLEIVVNHAGDTFRAVYTVSWPGRVVVLHVFQKKSKTGAKTPKAELDVIETRWRRLRDLQAEQGVTKA